MADAKTFLRRLALFSVPAVVCLAVMIMIDPFNFFGVSHVVPDGLKSEISQKINYAMWKMLAYRQDPVPNLLLGDSRVADLDEEYVEDITGVPWTNFGYGGGSLREAIQTFWFASEHVELERVCFGVNLHTYNANNNKDRVSEVEAALRNPLLYCVNANVVTAAGKLITAMIMGEPESIGRPPMTREEFWKFQLEQVTRVYFEGYRYPADYHRDLTEVAEHCRREGIELLFVVMPNHVELQAKVEEHGLVDEAVRFRQDLAQWGPVYDFAFANEMTEDRANYRDPYHFDEDFMQLIVRSVWGDEREFVHLLEPTTASAGDGEDHAIQ